MASAVASAIVSAWSSSYTVEAGFVSTLQTFRLSFTKISRRKLSISCSSSSQDASEAGGSSKPRRRKKSTDSPGVNGATKRASPEPEDKKVTRAKRKELDEKKSKKSKKTEPGSLEDDAQTDLTGDETEVIVGTDTDSDADVSVKEKKPPAGKKVTRAKRKEAAEKKVKKSKKKAGLEDDAQSEAGDETDMIEDTEEEEEASDAELVIKRTTKRSTRKKVTKAEKETSSEDDRREKAQETVKKPRKKKTAAEMKAEEEEDDQKKQSRNVKKAGKKPPKTTAGASEASDEKKLPAVVPEIVEDEQDEAKSRKTRKKPARKSTKETESFKKPMTDEEAKLLYEKEGRWQLMEEERRRLNQRYMEKLASSDEEEEEVYSEDDEDDEEVDEEEKPSDHIIDMKFPEKDCYALVESYKPRKIGKDEKPPLKNEELWWNWRKPDFTKEHYWSEHQKRQGLPDITLAAMTALTGRIKLFGDYPSVTETHIYRARKDVFYEERLRAEEKRRKEIGPMAYYQEWVKAWDKDTSKEAVQKHYEETGEDVAMQLMNMIACQTKAEFNHMMGTDPRIRRDPLVMRATKEMKRSVFGGDPVYPTVNYIKKPGAAVDFRGPNFHEPSPSIIERLKRCGIMKTREEHNKIMAAQVERMAKLAEEESDEESDEEMAGAIDIGEDEDEDVEGGADDDDLPFKEEDVSIVPTDELLQIPEEDDDI